SSENYATIAPEEKLNVEPAEQPAGAERGAAIREPRQPTQAVARGTQTRIRIPGEKQAYNAHYEVREADDVHASHNAFNFEPNPDYFYTNDRDYSNPVNQSRVIENSKPGVFDEAYLLSDTPTATDGPTVIDADGNALGGNNRLMTLKRTYGGNPEGAATYKTRLAQKAAQFGVDSKTVEGMRQPVLVRVIDDASLQPQKAITDLN